jgi:hypothetical protein
MVVTSVLLVTRVLANNYANLRIRYAEALLVSQASNTKVRAEIPTQYLLVSELSRQSQHEQS